MSLSLPNLAGFCMYFPRRNTDLISKDEVSLPLAVSLQIRKLVLQAEHVSNVPASFRTISYLPVSSNILEESGLRVPPLSEGVR